MSIEENSSQFSVNPKSVLTENRELRTVFIYST